MARLNQYTMPQAELEADNTKKVKKVSKRVMTIGKRNGLSNNDILSVQEYLKNGMKKKPAYALTHPNQKPVSCNANAHKLFNKPAVVKTIEEVLTDHAINIEKVLVRHDRLIEEAEEAGQYGVALSGNKDLFPVVGIEKQKENTTNNIFILGDGNANQKKIDEVLFGVIDGEVIE